MSLQEVQTFLDHEHKELLQHALEQATANRDAHPQNSFEHAMWDGWTNYFQKLIAQNRAMHDWTTGRFQSVLGAEEDAIAVLEEITEKSRPNKTPPVLRHIEHLKELLTIEREATYLMRKAAT